MPGVMAQGWHGLWALCEREPDLYPALGLHPVYLDAHQASDIDRLADKLLRSHGSIEATLSRIKRLADRCCLDGDAPQRRFRRRAFHL